MLTYTMQAAGAIHGDFERGFICADVMAYDVLKEIGSEGAVKAAGKLRQEGKNYVVADGGAPGLVYLVTTDVMMLCMLPWHISCSHALQQLPDKAQQHGI